MSERVFFSFRYAIPGYTFILLVIAINYIPLLKILETTQAGEAFGAFLAFLSLFTGSAFGFLISQIWWWRFKRNRYPFGIKELDRVADVIFEEYKKDGLKEPQKISEKKIVLAAVSDYIVHLEKEEEFLNLARRKWDMHHTLSSTLYALMIGFGVGIGCRFYYEIFLFRASFSILQNKEAVAEALALIFIFVCVSVLLHVIRIVRKRNASEYCPLLEAFIRKSEVKGEDLKRVFPNFFYE